jgi:23S rRNA (cytosine1962-C5)-methyltransferase
VKRIILKPGEEKRILAGHPWVYDNEVARILGPFGPAELLPGELADVESTGKTYLGRAFVNPHSKIIARIYSPSKEGVDKGFFKRRIREALARRTMGPAVDRAVDNRYRESARIVFGEADFLPGLIIDRFVGWPLEVLEAVVPERPLTFELAESRVGSPQSWLSIQFLAHGMDSRREEILMALEEVLAAPLGLPTGIIEKSRTKIRELEGLPLREGIIRGSFPATGIVIFENGFPFAVHLEDGQKTGHYLDQRENRFLTARYAQGLAPGSTQGARVLDVCAYTGGFGIHALRCGAASVTAVDGSGTALDIAMKNARLNEVEDRITPVQADMFDLLRSYERAKERFDLIILDPPAFAKTRAALEGAIRGYKEINLRALRLLTPGGLLVTCSCSHALDESRFKLMVAEAAVDAERRLVMLDFRYQAPDHPILLGYDESLYLKCGYFRVVI